MRFSIGITIHNEERNIGHLLDRLHAEPLAARGLEQVVVVSSGSTDASDRIVAERASSWPCVQLIVEPRRSGKAAAINLFIAAAGDVPLLVLMSGDVLPEPGAIDRLLDAFEDPEVGMVGGRPSPSGPVTKLIHRVVELQWDLHHEVSLHTPKLGEVVAFRNVLTAIPADTAVDEAAIEAAVRERGYRFAYAGDAVITNKGPESIGDFLKQRRRIAAGHHHLSETSGYQVSTSRNGHVARIVLGYLWRNPSKLGICFVTAMLEFYGRLLGIYDLRVRGRNPYIWDVATSTKDPVGVARTGEESS